MTSFQQIDVHLEDRTSQKWRIPLREDVFERFLSHGNPMVHKVFGDGSLFSPFLFGKFFDPSDAFPLWEFEAEILLSSLRSSGQNAVDWFQTDHDYVLKAELPGAGKSNVQVYVENGKIVEISGQWKQQRESKTKEWKSDHWWEQGYVRRLELPENTDWKSIEAIVNHDIFLEIRIPKKAMDHNISEGNDVLIKDFESV